MIKKIIQLTLLINFSFCQIRDIKPDQTINIFSPGFFEKRSVSTQQAARYAKNNILQEPYTTCTYNDNRLQANFGQTNDIKTLFKTYTDYCNNDIDQRVILTGISRGASTLFNFIGTHNPKNIGAIVAESPFATLDDVIQHTLNIWHIGWLPNAITTALMKIKYPAYDPHGIQPITSISEKNNNIPILIVCSIQDTAIPYTSSMRLAQKLKDTEHENVYLLVLMQGAHGFLSYQEKFQHVAHAFYARYNLPYNKKLAEQGITILEGCRL